MKLIVESLTKKYKNKVVVDGVSLSFEKGVYGLLGANGAGKTTLMRMICGLLAPDEGSVSYNGIDVSTEEYRACLGYLPQDFGYYPNFSGMDFLVYMAVLKGMPKKRAKARADELIRYVALEEAAKKKIKTYSGGMKQRLGIAQALLNEPEILILDEPTAGLDPKERVRFRKLLASLGKDNVVILSTHIVSDVDKIADRILLMKEGQIIFHGRRQDIEGDLEQFYLEQFGEEIE